MTLRTSSEMYEQPDLTLRLCLGGSSKENSLTPSSSVIGVISEEIDTSCSLPVDTDQLNLIKWKEFQFMRRFEAKKRLMEQRSGRASVSVAEKLPMKAAALPSVPSPSHMPAKTTASCIGSFSQNYLFQGHGSVGSRKAMVSSQTMTSRKAYEPLTNAAKRGRVWKSVDMMRWMPNVSTMGDGPNGRKVEGVLYKYKKGEVCILCVCHGSFLTPAEFVKHAGGTEAPNPMKQIHVYYTSYSL